MSTPPQGLGMAAADPPPGEQHAAGRRTKRREIGRKAQAKYRARQVEELQQATTAIKERQRACDAAKARLVGLLATHRTLNLRHNHASAAFLELMCKTRRSASSGTDPGASAAASGALGRTAESAAAPTRVDAALYAETISPPARNGGSTPPHQPLMAPEAGIGGSVSSRGSAPSASWSTGESSRTFTRDTGPELPEDGGARQVTLRLREARRAAAAAAGVPPPAIRWVIHSPHAAPGGEPLSFTSEFSTPECLTSIYACFFLALLEEPLLAAALDFLDLRSKTGRDGGGRGGLQGVFDADTLAGGQRPAHAATLAALDAALHGVNGLDDTQMVLRHGVAGRSPLGPAVRLAVQAICRAGRRNLPRPLWLRGCDLFVQFMAGVTQYKPLAAGACPHREVLPDGTEVHTVNTCPRCCVFGHMFETLREEIKAAVAGEAWEVEPVPLAEARARCAEVFSFCDLLVSQCMTDQPVAFRQMMCTVRAVKAGGLKAEAEIVLDLYRQLRMSEEQQEAAADAWRVWKQTRATLDRHLAAALQPLSALLDLPDLMLDDGTMPSTHSMRSIHSCGWTGQCGEAVATLGCGSAPYLPPALAASDDAALSKLGIECTLCLRGDEFCLCQECALTMAGRLLGGSARSTASAQRALDAVTEVHRRDAATFVEQLRGICMPGVIFTPDQYARQTALVLQRGALMDWLWLCKTAADETQREVLFNELNACCSLV